MRIVIMGGTSGIGAATAGLLFESGNEVIVTGRDPEKLAAVKDRVSAAEAVDGTSEAEVSAFFGRIGPFDHLVLAFSPGAIGAGALREVTLDDVRAGFDGKLFGYLSAIRHARVTGSITMVSAASARAGLPGTVTLAAVNGAIERIVSPLAAELAPVRVNAVAPGVIEYPVVVVPVAGGAFGPIPRRRAVGSGGACGYFGRRCRCDPLRDRGGLRDRLGTSGRRRVHRRLRRGIASPMGRDSRVARSSCSRNFELGTA